MKNDQDKNSCACAAPPGPRAKIRELGVARLTVHRTPRHIYAQMFDAEGDKVLVARLDRAEGRARRV